MSITSYIYVLCICWVKYKPSWTRLDLRAFFKISNQFFLLVLVAMTVWRTSAECRVSVSGVLMMRVPSSYSSCGGMPGVVQVAITILTCDTDVYIDTHVIRLHMGQAGSAPERTWLWLSNCQCQKNGYRAPCNCAPHSDQVSTSTNRNQDLREGEVYFCWILSYRWLAFPLFNL